MKKHVAVIGAGYWGKNLVRNFYELDSLRLICDANPDISKMFKDVYPDATIVQDYELVLLDKQIEAVAIATPAVKHYAMAKRALEIGKDVFVEKPLSLTVGEGESLVKLAAERKRILMVGHILQYHPAVIKLKELIYNGELGKIQYIYSNRLNMGKIRSAENILWSFAPHDISIMLSLLREEPVSITCQGGAYLNHDVADVTMSQFVFPSGVRGHIYVSWLHPFKEQRLVVVGSEKMAVFDDTAQEKLVVYPHKVEWKNRIPTAVKAMEELVPIGDNEPLQAECNHFLECVQERKNPITDGQEGLSVLKVLNACEASLSSSSQAQTKAASATPYFVHETASVDDGCKIGNRTKIWHYSHILKNAKIGENCIVGQNCSIASEVSIGNNVKVQNNVSIYTGVIIEEDVFLGPSCVFTNVRNPRSQINRHALYEKTIFRRGATIGANATIVCGVEVGRYAFVGAGAVVTKDVPDYALVMGNPSRQAGWMSRHGHRLKNPDEKGIMYCPESGYRYYEEVPGVLRCLDLNEKDPLPSAMSQGSQSSRQFRK
ncbi:MAG: oxidoreductase [Kiritimatiellae bacterium]|nr:oxidoreductase [Kiritimatiellia bacterium]